MFGALTDRQSHTDGVAAAGCLQFVLSKAIRWTY